MKFHILIVAAALVLSTRARAETADLWFGTIELPPGAHQQAGHGLDSAIGNLVSNDGTPAIGYDVGGHFDIPVVTLKDVSFYRHGSVQGIPWFAYTRRGKKDFSLSVYFVFQKGELPAIFGAICANRAERSKALRLILRFKPKKEALELEQDAQPPAAPPANQGTLRLPSQRLCFAGSAPP